MRVKRVMIWLDEDDEEVLQSGNYLDFDFIGFKFRLGLERLKDG